MLTGLLTGLVLAIITISASCLFRFVPGKMRKGVAIGMIVFGMLMIIANLPYRWGMLPLTGDSPLDHFLLGLLVGGGLMSTVGLFLLRMNREHDEGTESEVSEDKE